MSTSERIHGELLRLIFFISNKQAEDYFEALGYQPHSQEFCHRRGVFFQKNRGTIWHVLRLWRYVALPPLRAATALPLAARRPST